MLSQLKARVQELREAYALYYRRDPRTPWYAKALIFLVAHIQPIDLIPIYSILGYLDDLIITPGGSAGGALDPA
jgi:uncharacterized membrane protein YkvA (DUF1232 family)